MGVSVGFRNHAETFRGEQPACSLGYVSKEKYLKSAERCRALQQSGSSAGRGQYLDDIALAGELYAAFLRSPYPHANFTITNKDDAQALPGVVRVLAAHDIRLGLQALAVCFEERTGHEIS
jgi:xanthine dehydrogenase molybdopterin-binding subunit B